MLLGLAFILPWPIIDGLVSSISINHTTTIAKLVKPTSITAILGTNAEY